MDRARLDILRAQAVVALVSDANREISQEFRRRLQARDDAAPTLFSADELAVVACTSLETQIVRNIDARNSMKSTDAISDALCQRAEAYAREQQCQLIADRHPYATVASETVKRVCSDEAPVAARLVLAGQSAPKTGRVQLTENLLVQPRSGAGL